MAGELDYRGLAAARVALLAGLPYSRGRGGARRAAAHPGRRSFVRTLRRLGYHVGVVSGGFTVFTDRFVAELGLEFAAANELEVVDGGSPARSSGRSSIGRARPRRCVDSPSVRRAAEPDRRGRRRRQRHRHAGAGRPRHRVQRQGGTARRRRHVASTLPFLDTVLFMLGISGDEIDEVDAMDRARYAGSRD